MGTSVSPECPQDLRTLLALRDYLVITGRNTAAANDWLAANENGIILFYQRLNRALNNRNEAKAISLLAEMGDLAGFVLGLQDFNAKAEAAFGKGSAFQKAAAAIPPGLPAGLQESLPEISSLDTDILSRIEQDKQLLKIEESLKKPSLSVASWFHRKEKQQQELALDMRRQTHAVRDEILCLQSDRHYYIDSFMDWVADTLAPEMADENGTAPDAGIKMLQYQNPLHIIGHADADHKTAVETKTAVLRDAALRYSRLAEAIDRQDAHDIFRLIDMVYPSVTTHDSKALQNILLQDYHAASLPEIILKQMRSKPSRDFLLQQLRYKVQAGELAIPGLERESILQRIVHELRTSLLGVPTTGSRR